MQDRLVGRWERVKRLWDVGVAAVFAIAALSLGSQRFVSAFTAEGFADVPVSQISMLLFIETIALIFLWVKATSGEYQLLRDYLPEFIPPVPKLSFLIVVMLAILLGLLCYFSDNLVVYSAIFACYILFVIWGMWIRDSRIRVVLHTARSKASAKDERRKTWIIIENYYFSKPQVPLAVSMLFFSFVALTMGLSAELLDRQPITTWLLSAGYGVMVLNIAVPEVIYRIWRRKRDCDLHEEYD
jgi:hypothetical protein